MKTSYQSDSFQKYNGLHVIEKNHLTNWTYYSGHLPIQIKGMQAKNAQKNYIINARNGHTGCQSLCSS